MIVLGEFFGGVGGCDIVWVIGGVGKIVVGVGVYVLLVFL